MIPSKSVLKYDYCDEIYYNNLWGCDVQASLSTTHAQRGVMRCRNEVLTCAPATFNLLHLLTAPST